MNKTELIHAIREKSGLSNTDAEKFLGAFCDTVKETLKIDDQISLVGFGAFKTVIRAEKMGINPATQEKIVIPERKVVTFRASKTFLE